jgi:hypothetical protein
MTPEFTSKLSKVLARLGSSFDGERPTAGAMANKMVRDAGLDWPDVLARTGGTAKQSKRVWREPLTILRAPNICLKYPEVLTEWEMEFLRSVLGRESLSEKQLNVLQRLLKKVRAFATSGGT